jgi:hypothetical protein
LGGTGAGAVESSPPVGPVLLGQIFERVDEEVLLGLEMEIDDPHLLHAPVAYRDRLRLSPE